MGKAPRGACPACGRDTAPTSGGPIRRHGHPVRPGMCEGVGKTPSGAPGPDALLARLAEVTANGINHTPAEQENDRV